MAAALFGPAQVSAERAAPFADAGLDRCGAHSDLGRASHCERHIDHG